MLTVVSAVVLLSVCAVTALVSFLLLCFVVPFCSGGNQRETDRLRAQARAAKAAGGTKVGNTEATKKKDTDAEVMRKKQGRGARRTHRASERAREDAATRDSVVALAHCVVVCYVGRCLPSPLSVSTEAADIKKAAEAAELAKSKAGGQIVKVKL